MTIYKKGVKDYARNLGKEMLRFSPKNHDLAWLQRKWARDISRKNYKYFRCPECQKYLWADFNILQNHFMTVHGVENSREKQSKGWKFQADMYGRNTRVI